jgi:hypothetical protein
MTQVAISGDEFLVDGRPTYAGRVFEGHSIQGLLFNVRAVQATFDDANPATRALWAYPDTGEWDAERNVAEFCAALPSWRAHGVLGITLNFQGGGAYYAPEIYDHYDNNGFTPTGELRQPWTDRIARVLARADEVGMVVIMGLFYAAHLRRFENEEAIWRAAHNAMNFLKSLGHGNVLIEFANEIEVCHRRAGYEMFLPERAHELVIRLKKAYPEYLISLSQVGVNPETGKGIPPPALVEAVDYVLLHGNGARAPRLEAAIKAVQAIPELQRNPKPIVINEDSPGIPNLEVAWRNRVSWGYFDQGYGGPAAWGGDAYVDYQAKPRENKYEELSGFQTPPVNWTINTDLKRAFFNRVAEITGYSSQS